MQINRTPFQIILIEQFFYSLVALVFLVLFYRFGFPVLVEYSFLSAETNAYFLLGGFLVGIFSILYLWMPYTCVRVWRSACAKTKGFYANGYKLYALILFVMLLLAAFSTLLSLPAILSELRFE